MNRLFLAILILLTPAAAQIDDNAHAWFNYFGDHPVAKSRWGIHLEGQWRRHNVGLSWQQLLLRPGVNFQLTKNILLTGGYAFVNTYRYGDFPFRENFPEHRFFEQVQFTNKIRKVEIQNRLRFEQRNFGGYVARYENRFRYMLRFNVPLKGKYYLGMYNEIFYNYGKNVTNNVFDQNRAYIAIGHPLPKASRLEIGFMEQTLQQRSGRVTEHNHTLMISVFSKLPFFTR